MQTPPPRLFDRRLLRRRLARALDAGAPDFLITRAAEDLEDRLSAIKREFPRALDLGTPTAHFAQALASPKRPAPLRAALALGPDEKGLLLIADEEALPFANASLDLVVSGLALQWVDDLPGVFAQVRRILAPDGLFLACIIGGVSLFELRQALIEAESEVAGGASLRVSPFVDMRDLGGLLQRAGFTLPVTDVDSVTLRYDSMLALCAELHAMGAGNALLARRPLSRRALLRAAEIYAQKFSDPDGRVRATIEIIWLSGWAPHESQQKPLAPGSAQMRLEDAVKAVREGE
ncbi:MAG: methyltransferase domain-containing protein [Methylocystis sp.]